MGIGMCAYLFILGCNENSGMAGSPNLDMELVCYLGNL